MREDGQTIAIGRVAAAGAWAGLTAIDLSGFPGGATDLILAAIQAHWAAAPARSWCSRAPGP